jgi:hypothetical protein
MKRERMAKDLSVTAYTVYKTHNTSKLVSDISKYSYTVMQAI